MRGAIPFALAVVIQPLAAFPATARDSESSAVAALIAIGLQNAPTQFTALRGDLAKQNAHTSSYKASSLPDDAHYSSCFVYVVTSAPSSGAVAWNYACNSTPRAETAKALFAEIEPLVRANVPVGYSSTGIKMTVPATSGSLPWETWTRASSPDIILEVEPNKDGTVRYNLGIRQ